MNHSFTRLNRRLRGAYARRVAKWFGRRPVILSPGTPVVSFTFDDYPISAQQIGGKILEEAGVAGTYFSSLGLVDQETPTGKIFSAKDFDQLLGSGHEVGCHTFHHCPAWETAPPIYRQSLEANRRALAKVAPDRTLATHSYPISYPRPATKRHIARHFICARGGGQAHNIGDIDLNFLNSFFLEQCRDDLDRVRQAIAGNATAGGWLIFSTHDVCANPTRFGCTPQFFENVVRYAVGSGASILPVARAADILGLPGLP